MVRSLWSPNFIRRVLHFLSLAIPYDGNDVFFQLIEAAFKAMDESKVWIYYFYISGTAFGAFRGHNVLNKSLGFK